MNHAAMTIPRHQVEQGFTQVSTKTEIAIRPLSEGLSTLNTVFETGHSGFSCSPHWVGHWAACVNPNIVIATFSRNGHVVLALPLEIVGWSGLKIARFVGGNHANANFPAMNANLLEEEAKQLLATLTAQLKGKPWAVDAIVLDRQLEMLDGLTNPLLANGSSVSPNVSLHLRVDQSFDAVLETRSAKRKRKRYRSQERKFAAAGGFAIINPDARKDVEPILDEYFAMKAHQLRGKGVANVFGKPEEQAFFKALFSDNGPHRDHHFYLSSLRVGGKTRAIYGSSLHGLRQMVHFTAFSEDELTTASPGDFLNFSLVEAACKAPTEIYDLGVGDEGYKRSWCDVETWHRDVVIGISMRGKLAKLQVSATHAVKRWIKNNETLWAVAKRIRKLKGGRKNEPQQPSEDGSEL